MCGYMYTITYDICDRCLYRLYMIGINMFEYFLGACGRVRQKDVLVQKSSLTALIRRRFVVSEPTAPSVFHKHRFNQRHWWRILDHMRLPGRWRVWRSPTWHSAGVLSIAQAWVEHGAPRREFSDHKALKKSFWTEAFRNEQRSDAQRAQWNLWLFACWIIEGGFPAHWVGLLRPGASGASRNRGHPWAGMVGWRHHRGFGARVRGIMLVVKVIWSGQCGNMWQPEWTSVNIDFVVTGRPGASGRCAETGTSVYASECNEGSAANSPWFWIPHVRCWVAVEDGWGTRPVQILWCLNWQSAVMSKLHESSQIAVPTHQRTKSTWRTPSWLSLPLYLHKESLQMYANVIGVS